MRADSVDERGAKDGLLTVMTRTPDQRELKRLSATEQSVNRLRRAALAFSCIQSAIRPGDSIRWTWFNVACLFVVVAGISVALRGRPTARRLERLAKIGAGADMALIGSVLANNLNDPHDVVYLVTLLGVVELAMRWHLRGGIVGGLFYGLMVAVWTNVVLHRAGVRIQSEYLSMRLGVILLVGTFVGHLFGQLTHSRRKAENTWEVSRDLIVTLNLDGFVVAINPAALSLLGHDPDSLVGRSFADLLAVPLEQETWLRVAAGESVPVHEHAFRHRDGTTLWLELALNSDLQEHVVYVVGRDITERREAARRLALSEQRYKTLFENNPDPVFSVNLEGYFTSVNAAATRLTGLSEDALQAMNFGDLIEPSLLGDVAVRFERVRNGEPQTFDSVIRHPRGATDLHVTAIPITNNGEFVGIFGMAKDVTERNRLQNALAEQANHDPLTGLPNRRMFSERLNAAFHTGQHPSVLFIDLDGFKAVNDADGHEFGDEVLRAAAQRIASTLRASDLAGRFGGDEFSVLIGDAADPEVATSIAARITEAMSRPFAIRGRPVKVTASVGIAYTLPSGDSPSDLLRRADLAMYQAKESGKNRYLVYTASAADPFSPTN